MKEFFTESPGQTRQLGRQLAAQLPAGAVLALRGGLGAGKTTFVQGLAEGLGYAGEVTSPTFSLLHEYAGPVPLVHMDAYRIQGFDEAESTGLFDYLDRGYMAAVEWSENIADCLPGAITITFERLGDTRRRIRIEGGPF